MDFLNQTYYSNTKDLIKFQYRTQKGDLYIVTETKIGWVIYCNNKKIKASESYEDIAKLISEGENHS